jgi:hypothetical protein
LDANDANDANDKKMLEDEEIPTPIVEAVTVWRRIALKFAKLASLGLWAIEVRELERHWTRRKPLGRQPDKR